MKHRARSTRLALGAFGASVIVLLLQTADAQPKLALPPGLEARFRARGIDPTVPDLSSKLAALAVRRHSELRGAAHFRSLTRTLKPTGGKVLFTRPSVATLGATLNQPVITQVVIMDAVDPEFALSGTNLTTSSGAPAVTSASGNLGPCGSFSYGASGIVGIDEQGRVIIRAPTVSPPADVHGTLVVKTAAGTSPRINFALPAQPVPAYDPGYGYGVYVDYHPSLTSLSDNSLEVLGSSPFGTTAKSARMSTNIDDGTTTGTDTLGYGVKLVNGWTATAHIQQVSSYMDAPGDYSLDNGYRSAAISQQPSAGRLETRVAWSYGAGESLNYIVDWDLSNGMLGTRPADSLPKQTPCTNEQ